MPAPSYTRRDFLCQAALLTIGTPTLAQTLPAAAASLPVPFSSGTATPSFRLPANACDCHMHIYDSRFPAAPTAKLRPPPATVDMYRLLQRRLGTSRNVVVTPSTYGTDNRCTLDALAQFGPTARGIAVPYGDVAPLARALIQAAPDQVIWGSDWPHPTESSKPDDAALLGLLPEWAGSVPLLDRILVTNPARLYQF